MYIKRHTAPARQQGAALVVSLIILVVMTVIAVTAARTTTLEERMAGNARDRHIAFEAAEAALHAAEDYLENNISSTADFDADGGDGLYGPDVEILLQGEALDNNADLPQIRIDWDDSDADNGYGARTYGDFTGVASPPRYIIQHYGSIAADADNVNLSNYGQGTGAGSMELFKITVRATGGSNNAVVMLQTTYGRQL